MDKNIKNIFRHYHSLTLYYTYIYKAVAKGWGSWGFYVNFLLLALISIFLIIIDQLMNYNIFNTHIDTQVSKYTYVDFNLNVIARLVKIII